MSALRVSAPRDVCSKGVSALGVSALGVCGIPACTEADIPPPLDRITDACKNITLATIAAGNDDIWWLLKHVQSWAGGKHPTGMLSCLKL